MISKEALTKLVDAAPIGLFRILFGMLIVVEVLRYWAYEGHNFSWRMKLRDKSVREIAFYTRDPLTGRTRDLSTDQICEVIGRNDYHTDINVAVLKVITDVGIEFCGSS